MPRRPQVPIAFVDSTGTGPAARTVFRYDATTGSVGPLGPTPRYGAFPAYSPDGGMVVFTAPTPTVQQQCGAGITAYDLYLVSSEDTNLRRLTNVEPCAEAGDAAWSPDGKQIAYSINGILHVVDVSTGRDRALPRPPGWVQDYERSGYESFLIDRHSGDSHPSWSPNGKNLVFAQDDAYSHSDGIWVMDTASGASHQITMSPASLMGPPVGQGDGTTCPWMSASAW